MKKKGSALLVTIIIMSVIFTMAVIMISSTLKSNRQVRKDYNEVQSYYCAETGINDVMDDVCKLFENNKNISDYVNEQNNLFDNSNASYKVTANVISSNYSGSGGWVPPGHGGTPPGHGGTPPGHGGTPPGQSKKGTGNVAGKGNHYGWYKKNKSKDNNDYDIVIGITSDGKYYNSTNSIYVEIEIVYVKNSDTYDLMINYKDVAKLE